MRDEAPHILVVDDEPGMAEGCRRVLEAEGYRVETAVEATKRGAYGYVPKPFTTDELLLPVRNGLEKRALSIEARMLREERERQLLEVAFERSKSATIINCMTDCVLVVNRNRQLVLLNAAAVRAMPFCANASLPTDMDEVLGCGELKSLVGEALEKGVGPVVTAREITLDGTTYMANASPVLDPGGENLGAVAVLRDITALKKLETAKSVFVSMVAHEIKNPLAAVEGYIRLVLDGTVRDERETRETLQKACARAETLRLMVAELMKLRAMEVGQFVIRRSSVDVAEIMSEAVQAWRPKAVESGLEITFSAAGRGGGYAAIADRNALNSIFANLLDNAIKYTPPPGRITVKVEDDGYYVRASVRDTGMGMTDEEKKQIFEEFYRVRNEHTANTPGTGLGLSIVKRLVELHQGSVAVKSAPGEGTEFVVSIPAVRQREAPADRGRGAGERRT
ncbi:MAG TPA: hypothetical protein ENN09_02655 [Planctomycetes bacterium]|nr:hypothetical protein [Planctomycetota bacterium]